MATFKQLHLMGKGGPWELADVEIPVPGPGQALVKMVASSICNQTDLNSIRAYHPPHDHQMQGMVPHDFRVWDNRIPDELSDVYPPKKYPFEPYPTMMGHEGTGVIVDINYPAGEVPHLTANGAKLYGYSGMAGFGGELKIGDRVSSIGAVGGFGEYILAPFHELAYIPECIDKVEASLFEPMVMTNAICKNVVAYNGTVLILGQGALGLLCTQLARAYGAKTIITTDPQPFKREMSKKFGADIVLDPNETNIVEAVAEITHGVGCDTVLEAAGVPETIRIIPYVIRMMSNVGQIGACCVPVTVDWSYIHFKGMTVWSCMSSINMIGGIDAAKGAAVEMMASGKIDLASMITHRIPLTVEATEDIFAKIEKGDEVIKAAYVFED